MTRYWKTRTSIMLAVIGVLLFSSHPAGAGGFHVGAASTPAVGFQPPQPPFTSNNKIVAPPNSTIVVNPPSKIIVPGQGNIIVTPSGRVIAPGGTSFVGVYVPYYLPTYYVPAVSAPAPQWVSGYWAQEWVSQPYSYAVWVPGYTDPGGYWVDAHYENRAVDNGWYQPVWVDGYWAQ